MVGDFNCTKKQQKKSRWRAMEELMDRAGLRAVIPDFTTNFNPNLCESTLDYMLCTDGVEVTSIRSLDRGMLPGNTSSHIPVIFDVKYEEEHGDKEQDEPTEENKREEENPKLYSRKRRPNWAKKIDFSLYEKLEKVYSGVSYKLTEGLSAPWRLKLLEDMLSHVSSLAEIRKKRPRTDQELHTPEMRMMLRKARILDKRLKMKLTKMLGGTDWLMVPVRDILEIRPDIETQISPTLQKLSSVRQEIRTQQKAEWDLENEEKNREMSEALRNSDFKTFFEKNKVAAPNSNEAPQKIIYKGETYKGRDILKAYVLHAKTQSEDPRTVPGVPVDWKFVARRDIYLIRRYLAREDQRQLEHLDEESYARLLSSLKRNKAADLYNVTLEHLIYASQETGGYMVKLLNDILDRPKLYSHTSISRSLASMLHKGKNRPREIVGNYRRIQICSLGQKLLQRIISIPAGEQTKDSIVPTQWGFTPKVSFLQATFVRETLTKLANDMNTNIYLIASDVEAAFSRTERALQLYELSRQGESGKILLFSDAFYNNTDVVMSSGSDFSPLFQESRGAAQGSLLAPPHWKSYAVPLYSKLTRSGLGIKLAACDWSCLSVADDTITVTDSKSKLKLISEIYGEYSGEYGVIFGYDKTHLNIYGTGNLEELQKDIKFGGCELKVSTESDHLGLKVLQESTKTEERNTEVRITKANRRLFQVMGKSFKRRYPVSKQVTKTLLQSVVCPMLSSGLSALCMRVKNLQRLQRSMNISLRRTYAVGKISPTSPLLLMLAIMPLEGQIHHQSLALFRNIWDLPGPARDLLCYLFENNDLRSYHWSNYLRDICMTYSIPDPGDIIRLDPINKNRWNSLLKNKIMAVQERILTKKIHRSGMYRYIYCGDFSMFRKSIHPVLGTAKSSREIMAMQESVRHLLMENNTADNLFRKKVLQSPFCQYCGDKSERDSSVHMLNNCRLTKESSAARWARMQVFEQLQHATGVKLNELLSNFWTNADALTLTLLNPLSQGCDRKLKLEEENPRLEEVIKASQLYVLICAALRFRHDVDHPKRRKATLPGGNTQNHHGKNNQGPKGKSKFTKLRKNYNKSTILQSVQPWMSGGVNEDLRYNGEAAYTRTSKSTIVFSVLGPGLMPIITSAPGDGGRKLRKKMVLWASHTFPKYSKGLHLISSFDDVCSNLAFHTIEAFGVRDALKIANLAPMVYMSPELDVTVDCDHTVLPVTMVILEHDVDIRVWGLEMTDEMITLVMYPNLVPRNRFRTVLAQMFSELSPGDKATFTNFGAEIAKSLPIEDFNGWLNQNLEEGQWTTVKMSDRNANWPDSAWDMAMAINEWGQPGKTRKLSAQAKLQAPDSLSVRTADRLTQHSHGARPFRVQHPVEFLSHMVNIKEVGEAVPNMVDSISPIRGERPTHSRGPSSRLSSTPSGSRASGSRSRSGDEIDSKLTHLTGLVEKLNTRLSGRRYITPHRPMLDTTSEMDESVETTGRHAEAINALQRKQDEMKRKRSDTSEYTDLEIGLKYLMMIISLRKGNLGDGPNGTINISSDDHETTSHMKVELGPDNGRRVTVRQSGGNNSAIMISSSENSPTLKEAPHQVQGQELTAEDARHKISGDLRFQIDSNRLTSTAHNLAASLAANLSPQRRTESSTTNHQGSNARNQSQRPRFNGDGWTTTEDEAEEHRTLLNAIAASQRGEENEDTKKLVTHTVYIRADEEGEDFVRNLDHHAVRAIANHMDQFGQNTVFIPKTEPGSSSRHEAQSPPPTYEATMRSEAELNSSSSTNNNSGSSASTTTSVSIISEPGYHKGQIKPFQVNGIKKVKTPAAGLASNLAERRMKEDDYKERLRDHQFSDPDMSPPRDETALNKREENMEDPKEEKTGDQYEGMPPLEDSTSSEDVTITGHGDNTTWFINPSKTRGEKEKPKGKKKKPAEEKLHDSYHVIEEGTLVGSARILKECREGTGPGDVMIVPKTPETSFLDTTGADTDHDSSIKPKPKYEIHSKEGGVTYQDVVKTAGASRVLEYDDDIMVIHTTSEEEHEMAPEEEDGEDELAAIQRLLEEDFSSPPSSGNKNTHDIDGVKVTDAASISRSKGPGRGGQQGSGTRRGEGGVPVSNDFIENAKEAKIDDEKTANDMITMWLAAYYLNSIMLEFIFDVVNEMIVNTQSMYYKGMINPTLKTTCTELLIDGGENHELGMDSFDGRVEARKDGQARTLSMWDKQTYCQISHMTESGVRKNNSNSENITTFPKSHTPFKPQSQSHTNQTLVHHKPCPSSVIFTLNHLLILFLSPTHFSPTSRRPSRNQSQNVSGYPVCNLQWQFMSHSAGGLGTRSLDNLLCTGE